MAWNHFLLSKPTNVTATLQDGGNLDANTTYYVKVLAIAKTTDTRQTSGWINIAPHYSGEWSDTVTFTTTSTQRSVLLEWDRVYKHSGVEVEGYDVLVSKTGSFPHHGQILRAPSYLYPTTSNNYYLLDVNANYYYRYVPYGFPYIWWSGTGTATPDNLYEYMRDNIPNFETWVSVFRVPHLTTDDAIFGYNINACIVINRSSDDLTYDDGHYTFDCKGRIFLVWGTFNLAGGKVRVRNSFLFSIGPGHHGGNNFFAPAADGSEITASMFFSHIGDGTPATSGGIHFANSGAGRLWADVNQAASKTAPNQHDTIFGYVFDFLNGGNFPTTSYPRDLVLVGHPDKVASFDTKAFLKYHISTLSLGVLNNVKVSRAYAWNPCYAGSWCYGLNMSNGYIFFESNLGWLVNVYHESSGVGTLYVPVYMSSSYRPSLYLKASLMKTIKVKVIDKNANPVSGVKVSFYGPNNEKLTLGNQTTNCVSFIMPRQIQGYNYDSNNQNPPYDTTNLWVKYYTNEAGKIISELEAGKEYFILGERIKVTRRITGVTPPETDWQLYEVERGYSGVRPGLLAPYTYYGAYYHHLLEAPDYHTTDANGEVWNITPFADYRLETLNYTQSVTKSIRDWANEGVFSEKLYLPIRIHIEAPGYQDVDVYVSYEDLLLSKNDHLRVLVKLPDQVKFLMPMGERIYKNLKPSDGQNKVLWTEV